MCGCCSAAVVSISWMNRSAPSTAASSGFSTLIRDLALVLEVLGEVDRGHPPYAELALDACIHWPAAQSAISCSSRRSRVASRLAETTQWITARR